MPSKRQKTKRWLRSKRAGWNDETQVLALQVETEFIADPQRRTIEHWWQKLCQKKLSLDAIRAYAADNQWHEKRQSFWRGVQAAWLRQQRVRLVQQRIGELKDAVDIREFLARKTKPVVGRDGVETVPFKVNSYEGLLRAFVQVDGMVEAKREAILDGIDPMLAAVEETTDEGTADLPFKPGEMRDLAHGLLRKRLAQRHAELGIDDDDEDDEGEDDDAEVTDAFAEPVGDAEGPAAQAGSD